LSQLLPLWQQINKQPKVLCHHDLSIANLLFLSDNIVFADWEYAALGNPLLDIAFCFEANQWSKEIEKRFCDAYSKHTDANRTNEVWEKVQLFRPLAIHTNRLWQRAAAKIRVQPE
jgi:thiamine kinase